MNIPGVTITCNATDTLPTSADQAVLFSRGSNNMTGKRATIILQVQSSQPGAVYVSNGRNKLAVQSLELLPTGNLYEDIFAATDDLYAWAASANTKLTYIEGWTA